MKMYQVLVYAILVLWIPFVNAETACPFDDTNIQYIGTRTEQASCLLRTVKRFGKLEPKTQLPTLIEALMKQDTINYNVSELQKYLQELNISEADVGGILASSINKKTKYFIIHDTSSPNYKSSSIPSDIDDETWNGNKLSSYSANAHVYINRLGESVTKVDLSKNHRTTKFELQTPTRMNLFVGVELIQPRKSYPDGSNKNDATAPTPGFTKVQLDRLAVVYLAASLRAGHYLIPTYHSVIDAGIKGGHDDPQNFNLHEWADSIQKILDKINQPASPSSMIHTPLICNDYASWKVKNKDCTWTIATEKALLQSTLSEHNPSDILNFCPNYPNLATVDKNKFWAGLLSAMARPESNYDTNATYEEKFTDLKDKKVISRGLLQISVESANGYKCGINNFNELHNASINLSCGVKILDKLIKKDNVIATYDENNILGGGRYWSVLRKNNNFLNEIAKNTSSLVFCKLE